MKKDYKTGIDFVFEQNPKLTKIGTKEQYEEYLKAIFPESKIKNIVWHHSDKKIKKFKANFIEGYAARKGVSPKAIFFLGSPAKEEFLSERKHIGAYLINSKSPWKLPPNLDRSNKRKSGIKEGINEALNKCNDAAIFKNIWDNRIWSDVYCVFHPSQIHILGSKKDIKEFIIYIEHKSKKRK
jgi:hypothetical protein